METYHHMVVDVKRTVIPAPKLNVKLATYLNYALFITLIAFATIGNISLLILLIIEFIRYSTYRWSHKYRKIET